MCAVFGGEDSCQRLKNYLEDEGDPDIVDIGNLDANGEAYRESLLELCAAAGNTEMVELLLEKGASVLYADKKGHHALYMASAEGHPQVVKQLIQAVLATHGVGILQDLLNQADERGITSLHIASVNGHGDVVQQLLRSWADIDQQDPQGRTALHFACYKSHDAIITTLLDYGAQDLPSTTGLYAKDFFTLGMSQEYGRRNPALAKRLEKPLSLSSIPSSLPNTPLSFEDASSQEFMKTFQRKCGSIFLAYRTLDSGAVQGTKDILCVSNVINILGNIIPLPGGDIVTTVAVTAVGMAEDHWEEKRKKALTEFFITVGEMEIGVARGAYELTQAYQDKITSLTPRGAATLAECATARFVAYMRDPRTVFDQTKTKPLSEYILESVRTVEANSFLAQFAFWQRPNQIETKDQTLNWTDQEIFQGTRAVFLDPVLNPQVGVFSRAKEKKPSTIKRIKKLFGGTKNK